MNPQTHTPDRNEPRRSELPETRLPEGGVRGDDDMAADALPEDLGPGHPKVRQEDLLDEGVEETFPASDPVSVKRIT